MHALDQEEVEFSDFVSPVLLHFSPRNAFLSLSSVGFE